MKILELGKFYPPHYGGMETLLRAFCEGFLGCGAEVECVVANDRARTEREILGGVPIHRLASFGLVASTAVCPSYLSSTRRMRADIWHHHFPNPLADLAGLLGPRRVPLVMTYHSDVIRQKGLLAYYGPVLRAILQRATRIVVGSPQLAEFSPWLAKAPEKIEVIPFGIRLEAFTPTETTLHRAAELRREAGGRPIVLSIGRLVEYKGHRFLIEAARNFDAAIWIIGEGPLEAELRATAAACGVAHQVRFCGSVTEKELPAHLHACDVFALPSITPNEAFGLAQIEAMACGKPVVSCRLPTGVPFVNQDRVTGLVIEPRETGALAEAIRSLLTNAEWRLQLGTAGRARANKEFAEGVMIQRYWALFQRLTRGVSG